MKWAYTIKNKVLASSALLSLCVLVLVSNYIDRNHTENVKKSISTLYEDRLIAENYILQMTSALYQIRGIVIKGASSFDENETISKLLSTINEVSNAYHKTKFTELEKIKAGELIQVLNEIEPDQRKSTELNLESVEKALLILNELSNIQLAESKQIMNRAEKLYLTGEASSKFVFALIILILVVLQALVFTTKTLIPSEKLNNPNLN